MSDIVAIGTALTAMSADKEASTGILTTYVGQFNALAQLAWNSGTKTQIETAMLEMAATLTDYVRQFDKVTVDIVALDGVVATATADDAAQTIGMANLTDAQVATMQTNPQQYFCAGYLCIVNSILAIAADQPTMLSIAGMVGSDLVTDINNAWSDLNSGVTPAVPRPSVIYDNANALNTVLAGLQAATPSPATPA